MVKWLDSHAEELKQGYLSVQKEPSRGQLRDQLNWLGALRIKEYYGRKNLAEDNFPNLKVPAPYKKLSDLYGAAKKALKIIDKRIRRITETGAG